MSAAATPDELAQRLEGIASRVRSSTSPLGQDILIGEIHAIAGTLRRLAAPDGTEALLAHVRAGAPVALSITRDGVEVHCLQLLIVNRSRVARAAASIEPGDIIAALTTPTAAPDGATIVDAHVCLECGAVWDRPTNCPFNGAHSPTVPADAIAQQLLDAQSISGEELLALRDRINHGEPDVPSDALRSAYAKLDAAARHAARSAV